MTLACKSSRCVQMPPRLASDSEYVAILTQAHSLLHLLLSSAPWQPEASARAPPCLVSVLAGRQPSSSLLECKDVRQRSHGSAPMPMATMAESVLHAVAGVRVVVLFVLELDLAAYIGSIAPSHRYGSFIVSHMSAVLVFKDLVCLPLATSRFENLLHRVSVEVFVEEPCLDSLVLALFAVVGVSNFVQEVG